MPFTLCCGKYMCIFFYIYSAAHTPKIKATYNSNKKRKVVRKKKVFSSFSSFFSFKSAVSLTGCLILVLSVLVSTQKLKYWLSFFVLLFVKCKRNTYESKMWKKRGVKWQEETKRGKTTTTYTSCGWGVGGAKPLTRRKQTWPERELFFFYFV